MHSSSLPLQLFLILPFRLLPSISSIIFTRPLQCFTERLAKLRLNEFGVSAFVRAFVCACDEHLTSFTALDCHCRKWKRRKISPIVVNNSFQVKIISTDLLSALWSCAAVEYPRYTLYEFKARERSMSSSKMGILGHQPITGLHFVIDSSFAY